MLLSLLVGSIPGIVIGSLIAPRVHERVLSGTLIVNSGNGIDFAGEGWISPKAV